jgi:hypothetical protein
LFSRMISIGIRNGSGDCDSLCGFAWTSRSRLLCPNIYMSCGVGVRNSPGLGWQTDKQFQYEQVWSCLDKL